METHYKALRRPKRKLCYLTNKESPPKQWTGKLTLGDIDEMFDDLDSSSHEDDIIPPSPLLQTFASEANKIERGISTDSEDEQLILKSPGAEDVVHSARRSLSPEIDIVLNIPLKLHGPQKTSSPIEENLVVGSVEEDNERALVVPQILDFEDVIDPVKTQKPESDGLVTEKNDSALETPPSKVTLCKATLSNHKKQAAGSCKDSPPVKSRKCRKPQTPVSEDERKTSRQEKTEPAVSALRQDPELPCLEQNSGDERQQPAEVSACRGKAIQAFLQKVREAEKSKLPCSRTLQALVQVPTSPPELEDEFLIIEDDSPYFYIPCKTTIRKRQRQKEINAEEGSTDKDRLAVGSHSVNQKMKRNKEKSEVIGHQNRELSIPEEYPGSDVEKQKKPNKKKQWLQKVQSKEIDKAEEEHKYRDSKETEKEICSQNVGRRAQKSSEVKSSLKSPKDGKLKASRAKSLKKITNVMQRDEDIKQTESSENVREPNTNYADAEEPSCLSEIVSSEAHKTKAPANGKANQKRLPVVSEESSSKESQVLEKRKRKLPGHWWLSCPEITEETEGTDNQLTLKKSRQINNNPRAAVPSSVQIQKDNVSKSRNRKQPVPSSSENTNANHDLDLVHSSPLDLIHRDLSLSSGNQVFQKVYQHVSADKMPRTPRRPQQEVGDEAAEKRTRKPPGSWWLVEGKSEDGEQSLLQSQHLHHKKPTPCKKQKNLSKRSRSIRLRSPKNGNVSVSPKPLGGATAPCLKPQRLSASKSVKNSLAFFKDIFTSETETAVNSGDVCQSNRQNDPAHPAEEVSVFLQNLETPTDSRYHSEDTQKELISGPSSMIQLEQYEENEDLVLPSSRVHAALSISDMCGPPLKSLILQPKDKANLRKWLKTLWPTVAPNAAEITPNHFDWYFYQDRAIGFLLDVDCGFACSGRILLGSYMKKPLWVDHSSTTVFNLLTSSVKVVINGKESCIDAGQGFTVECGNAYSIQNMYAQPAVLYFTRILTENLN
ncbi:hypothetical protein Q5P01_004124 [Channa striata]|uniref:Mif2/CENP-C cupin domain-containing protein n=1 Tax=Channa striata TaxID=64152 RepID=A0AA88NH45_CHASR|nr:hypothetical protein Q5P01_004124 [Channa striata]